MFVSITLVPINLWLGVFPALLMALKFHLFKPSILELIYKILHVAVFWSLIGQFEKFTGSNSHVVITYNEISITRLESNN